MAKTQESLIFSPSVHAHWAKGSLSADCTTLVSHNSAAIAVCGAKDDQASVTSCSDLAGFADLIQQTCKSGEPIRAGGTYQISASKKVEVIAT